MKNEIIDVLYASISKACKVPKEELSINTRLDSLSLDSLKLVEVIFEVESKFQVEANEEKMGELETLRDVIGMFLDEMDNSVVESLPQVANG